LTITAECSATMVDMPIGLPASSSPRLCDELARRKLGATSNRLFFAPPRSTLRAATAEEFQQLHREATGKGAGLPVWSLVEKLRQVDQAMTPSLQDRVMEFHPELAWQHLNGGTPLISKHQPEGLTQRQALLRPHAPELDQLTVWKQRLGRAAGLDDLLDALVGLAAAQAFVDGPDTSRRIPAENPPVDERGLRMEIWF
jgi:predicted RNase H-like nuclease